MSESIEMKIIGRIHSDLPTKFGIPRQAGLVEDLRSTLVFEPEYRDESAFRGLADFSHIWLIWDFSKAHREEWSPTVRPPRLGGNERMGVFATRSPFRPNPIGLSCVKLIEVKKDPELGPVLVLGGADLMDGTPVFDVKPYIPYADAHPEASEGFTSRNTDYRLNVEIPAEIERKFKKDTLKALYGILAEDPRPHYQEDPERVYGFEFAGFEVKFKVDNKTAFVVSVEKMEE